MNYLKKVISEILFVSKITGVNNKKIIIFSVAVLSQITALSDVLLIVIFAAIITGSYADNFTAFLIEFFLDNTFLLPFVVIMRFYVTYLLAMTMKKLEFAVSKNIKVHLLSEVFEKRNYSVADAYFYLNQLAGHVSFFYANLASFLNSLLQVLAFVIYLTITDSQMFLILMLGIVVLFYPVKFLITKAREYMHKIYVLTQISSEEIQRIVDNTFLIKLLKKEEEELKNFDDIISKQNHSSYQNISYSMLNGFLPSFMTLFTFSVVVSFKSLVSALTVDLIAVTLKLFQSLGEVTNSLNAIINSHVHISKLFIVLKSRNVIDKNNFQLHVEKSDIAVEVKNIDFKYFNSDVEIFKNLSLQIPKSSHVILTGANGSGKSTLLGLLAGVYYANNGKVFTSSNNYGYIGATPLIFSSTLRENIMYGNQLNISDDKIYETLKDFDIFKEEQNYNLDKEIDNKSLSSGQMQKIAFVRALLSDVDILILDESTANLDDQSRDLVFEILKNKDITIINSTHDPEQFKNIDLHININIVDELRVIEYR